MSENIMTFKIGDKVYEGHPINMKDINVGNVKSQEILFEGVVPTTLSGNGTKLTMRTKPRHWILVDYEKGGRIKSTK